MTDQEARQLFDKLKRDGDCWHVPYTDDRCGFCGKVDCSNPNFTNPDWTTFGWAWERAMEKDWWKRFTLSNLYSQESYKNMTESDIENDYDGMMYEDMVNPNEFIKRLKKFLEERNDI